MKYTLSKGVYKEPSPNLTMFAAPSKILTDEPIKVQIWQACREGLHKSTRTKKSFLVKDANIDRLIKFITWIEDRLNLTSDEVLRWDDTDDPNIKVVHLSYWWHVPIRRSFLTAAMRDAKCWNENTGEVDWDKAEYFKYTKDAAQRFINGYTHFQGKGSQWLNVFSSGDYYSGRSRSERKDRVEKWLVKPTDWSCNL